MCLIRESVRETQLAHLNDLIATSDTPVDLLNLPTR